jgi:hypothetical protein
MKKIFGLICLFTVITTVVFAQIPTNGLVGYWPFNGNANDESGNGHNAIINEATLVPDRFGNTNQAYSFNGYQIIEIPHSEALNIIGDLTISAWFNINSSLICCDYSHYQILQKRFDGAPNYTPYIFAIGGYGTKLEYVSGANETYQYFQAPTTVSADTWQHAVCVIKNDTLKLYLDDILILSALTDNTLRVTNTAPLWIGSSPRSKPFEFFVGMIDDVRLYNRALSEAEIVSLYHEMDPISVVVGSIDVTVNDTVEIPVSVKFPLGKTYSSMELSFVGFQNSGVTFLNIDTTNCLIGEKGWQLLSNNTDSVLVIASAGSQDISDSLLLFKLKFLVTGNPCSFQHRIRFSHKNQRGYKYQSNCRIWRCRWQWTRSSV